MPVLQAQVQIRLFPWFGCGFRLGLHSVPGSQVHIQSGLIVQLEDTDLLALVGLSLLLLSLGVCR